MFLFPPHCVRGPEVGLPDVPVPWLPPATIVLGVLPDTRSQAVRHEELSLDPPRCGLWVGPSGRCVAVVRVVDIPLGGIQPEAFALIEMMTAPLTLGAVVLATLVTWGLEKMVRRRRPARA